MVYGPVQSRRLGRSLGINALPGARKVCSFNCVYCQYGWTDPAGLPMEAAWQDPAAVVEAVEAALDHLDEPPAYITFSGNGEPTLHPRFPALVDGIIRLRDRRVPAARTAILSNSSRAGDPPTRTALARLDQRIMKLDAGNQNVFQRYNGPRAGLTLAQVVEGLHALAGVTIQTLFAGGKGGNFKADDIQDWLETVQTIAPEFVQIYTLARGFPAVDILPLTPTDLATIGDRLAIRGIPFGVY
jgi:wyosine [tRNA(Phe)-imidazoG37] synthetase (radical SAM superfamily)